MRTLAILAVLCLACPLFADSITVIPSISPTPIPDGLSSPPPDWGPSEQIDFGVALVERAITSVEVEVTFSHAYAGDVGMYLRSPGGVAVHVLFERIGATTTTDFGYPATFNGTYTFRDSASSNLWTTAATAGTGAIPGGVYRTSFEGGTGAGGTLTTMNDAFTGLTESERNGTWTLFIADATAGDTGTVTGARLKINFKSAKSGGGGEKSGCSTNNTSGISLITLLAAASSLLLVYRRA